MELGVYKKRFHQFYLCSLCVLVGQTLANNTKTGAGIGT